MAIAEMEHRNVPFLSVTCPLKSHEGVLSCGVGHEPWRSWRRLTNWECHHTDLPATFDMADILRCIPGKWPASPYLLHNNGCFVADLRDERWHREAADGNAAVFFQFPKRMYREPSADNRWMVAGESEDWFFSRRMHEAGIPSVITSKIHVTHHGGTVAWNNYDDWGTMKHDEATRKNWGLDA